MKKKKNVGEGPLATSLWETELIGSDVEIKIGRQSENPILG